MTSQVASEVGGERTSPPFLTLEETIALAEIKRNVSTLVGPQLKLFSLFGSKARGDFGIQSDVDLVIVVEGLNAQLKRRIIDHVIESEMDHGLVISSLVLSWKEFSHLHDRERRIALDIEREGVPL